MDVVIVESPAKAKTINKYLGSGYKVLASFGHIRDLPSKDGSVKPDDDFSMLWEVDSAKAKRLKEITDETKKADRVILATDPDREGEAISWHLLEVLKQKKALPKGGATRVTFNEITKSAVTKAMAAPRDLDMDLISAYLARRGLDYLVGFTLSPVLWRKLPGARSAGRVQSVALRLVCDREMEIEKFISREYWTVLAHMTTVKGEPFTARLTHLNSKKLDKFDLNNADLAGNAQKIVQAGGFSVSAIETKPATRNPYAPFTTSTLQQEAARKLHFSATQTMRTAQALYEGVQIGGEVTGLITYMRTDGVQISQEAIFQARGVIERLHGKDFVPEKPRFYSSKAKNAQEAHEGIRPTDLTRLPRDVAQYVSAEQLKLYELIWKRTIASQMASARMERTAVDLVNDKKTATLRATGQVILFPGFLAVYEEDIDDRKSDAEEDDSARLPKLTDGEKPAIRTVDADQHFTEPPPRYSEASIVKRMEELGIGRPSTYASTLQTLRDRDYVRMEKNRIHPQDKGRLVTAFLEKFFERYIEYNYTAGLEEQLDDVSDGKRDWRDVLRAFWQDFKPKTEEVLGFKTSEVIAAVDDFLGDYLYKAKEEGANPRACPTCGNGILGLKAGKFGAFLGCSNYPECKYTRPFGAAEDSEAAAAAAADKVLGQDPETGEDIFQKNGRFGPYVQRGAEAKEGEKLARASIPRDMQGGELTFENALKLLSLPRKVGKHPETGEEITANLGRYGPYLAHNGKYAKLQTTEDVFNVGMNMAVALLAAPPKFGNKGAPREPAKAIKELGNHPETGVALRVMPGRYGPYITDGTINATVPKDGDPQAVTLEQAIVLLAERAARIAADPSSQKKRPVKKAAVKKAVAKKTGAKKPAESNAKKAAEKAPAVKKAVKKAKKTPAKKAATKKKA
jgi:DNA topoisomerase I